MKTPREILLARHRVAEFKLDVIRRSVVAGQFNNEGTKKQSCSLMALILRFPNALWRELILPSRRIWTGLAAVWFLLFVINLSQRDPVSSVTGQPVRSVPVVMSAQMQQRLMNEVLADRLTPPDVDRPKNVSPRPHTEHRGTTTV